MGLTDYSLVLHRHPEFDPIVWRVDQILLRSQVSFGGLDGSVPKKHLDLLQFAAGRPAQFRASATIMPHAALQALCRVPDYAECLLMLSVWRRVRELTSPDHSA